MDVSLKVRRHGVIFLLVAGAVLWIPTARLFFGRPPGFLSDLGFVSGPPGNPQAWALALAVAVAYSAYALQNPLVRRYWLDTSLLKLAVVPIAVAAAIVEEAVFRRMLMDWVQSAGGGAILQILASGVVFGVAHGIWGIVTGRIVVGLGVMFATGTLGAALGAVYIIGDRSLAPPIAAHFIIDLVIHPGIVFAAFSGYMRLPKVLPSRR